MTAQEIYDLAMDLMDEKKDLQNVTDTPESDYASTKDYQARTPGILTMLQTQVVMYLKGLGADIDSLDPIGTLADEVELDQDICQGVLPYGLAARLLGQEDKNMSAYFSNLYNQGLSDLKDSYDDKFKAKQEVRENVYGLLEAGD